MKKKEVELGESEIVSNGQAAIVFFKRTEIINLKRLNV